MAGAFFVKIGVTIMLVAAGAITLQNLCFTTIPAGQAAAVWDVDGSVEVIEGPKHVWSVRKKVQFLARQAANPKEYLVIKYVNGSVEHVAGPASVRFHPLLHESIRTRTAVTITGNEVLVVYRRNGGKNGVGDVERLVIHGPGVHVPTASEWSHEFVWHGSDPRNKARKIKKGRQFTKLRTVPTQMYYNVDNIRSRDDQMLTIKLMIFFELFDIETMLDMTHDPIGDFINAVSADTVKFAANRTYEELSLHADQLNSLNTYPQLTARAERIGYRINKVVYRGYKTTEQLQQMHNEAIYTRTQLRLRQETESEAQLIKDMVLDRETTRAQLEREEQTRAVMHEIELQAQRHQETLRQQREAASVQLAALEAEKKAEAEHLQQLAGLGVDLTQVLVARSRAPDKFIRIESTTDSVGEEPQMLDAWDDMNVELPEWLTTNTTNGTSTATQREQQAARRAARRAYRRAARAHHPDKSGNLHFHFDDDGTNGDSNSNFNEYANE